MSRGHDRERRVRDWLTERDWVVVRAAGSLGGIDLVAMRGIEYVIDGEIYRPPRQAEIRLVEVKSTAQGPYEHFGPADRKELAGLARLAGAEAWLAWWPSRGKLRWIEEAEWPT